MVFERPQRPGKPQNQPSADKTKQTNTPRPNSNQPKRIIDTGGGGRNSSSRQGDSGKNDNPPPSPWLDSDNEPNPAASASFVEYLRWMRSPDSSYKDPTKVQLLQMAEEKAIDRKRLTQLTERTQQIAGEENTFQVKCPWRIRVGGHRGPESILLPAFDTLGMPYIPSSTLRGVARTQAIREIMAQGVNWKQAEKQVAPYFGCLDAKNPCDRASKVIFLDAYPLPSQAKLLAVDMANNIWNWEKESLKYSPNPNPFFSLKEPTFLIGLRRTTACKDDIFNQVKNWLIKGLQSGIGSQVNTGYGELIAAGKGLPNASFFEVDFTLQGQLIHGRQKFTQWMWNDRRQEWQMRGQSDAEVRPVAYKSMLRYWFRTFALGVLEPKQVQTWEAKLFGSINPQERGWVTVRILQSKLTQKEPRSNSQGKSDPCGEQQGILTLSYSCEAPQDKQDAIAQLFKNLTWLMFHLGGIGQGARRSCYSRQTRDCAPWYRGSTLIADSDDSFWHLPDTPKEFQSLFQQRLKDLYTALSNLGAKFNYRSLRTSGSVSRDQWFEAIDTNCCIVVCTGKEDYGKPYALAVLHSQELKTKEGNYDGNLCGKVAGGVKPSPVWIADLGEYQVVTVFGATQAPRKKYLQELRECTTKEQYIPIFPLI